MSQRERYMAFAICLLGIALMVGLAVKQGGEPTPLPGVPPGQEDVPAPEPQHFDFTPTQTEEFRNALIDPRDPPPVVSNEPFEPPPRDERPRFDPSTLPQFVLGMRLKDATEFEILGKIQQIEGQPQGVAREYLMLELVRRVKEVPGFAEQIANLALGSDDFTRKAILFALGRASTPQAKEQLLRLAGTGIPSLLGLAARGAAQEGKITYAEHVIEDVDGNLNLFGQLGYPTRELFVELMKFWNPALPQDARLGYHTLMSAYVDSKEAKATSDVGLRALDLVEQSAFQTLRAAGMTSGDISAALDLLARLPRLSPDVQNDVMRTLRFSSDSQVRASAACALGADKDLSLEVQGALLDALTRDPSAHVRRTIHSVLWSWTGRIWSKRMDEADRAAELLRRFPEVYASDPTEAWRLDVLRIYGPMLDPRVDPYIEEVVRTESLEGVRTYAQSMLERRRAFRERFSDKPR
jgi:hypothetical protein